MGHICDRQFGVWLAVRKYCFCSDSLMNENNRVAVVTRYKFVVLYTLKTLARDGHVVRMFVMHEVYCVLT